MVAIIAAIKRSSTRKINEFSTFTSSFVFPRGKRVLLLLLQRHKRSVNKKCHHWTPISINCLNDVVVAALLTYFFLAHH